MHPPWKEQESPEVLSVTVRTGSKVKPPLSQANSESVPKKPPYSLLRLSSIGMNITIGGSDGTKANPLLKVAVS